MASKSGQDFIGKIRPPRVHISYAVETFGAREVVSLPFVMGVMSDLSGDSRKEKVDLEEREFDEVDMDNFEKEFMKSIAPRVDLEVDNVIGDGGKLSIGLDFKKMEDFSPGKIAKNVPALAKLLEARGQLNDLMTYMDGKSRAQGRIRDMLKDGELMEALAELKVAADAAAQAKAAAEAGGGSTVEAE